MAYITNQWIEGGAHRPVSVRLLTDACSSDWCKRNEVIYKMTFGKEDYYGYDCVNEECIGSHYYKYHEHNEQPWEKDGTCPLCGESGKLLSIRSPAVYQQASFTLNDMQQVINDWRNIDSKQECQNFIKNILRSASDDYKIELINILTELLAEREGEAKKKSE